MIDANVFVSAAIQRGASHRIVTSWLAGTAEIQLEMSPELLAEDNRVITGFSGRCGSLRPSAERADG